MASAGSVQTILVCVPKQIQNGQSIAPCANLANVRMQPEMRHAYVIDPGQQTFMDAILEPFDYGYAGGLWTLSFSMVIGLFVISRYAGAVLEFIRRG
jgi:hypothetical protein